MSWMSDIAAILDGKFLAKLALMLVLIGAFIGGGIVWLLFLLNV